MKIFHPPPLQKNNGPSLSSLDQKEKKGGGDIIITSRPGSH